MKRILFFCLFQWLLLAAYGQYPEIEIERLSVEQGFNEHNVLSIIQDHTGFIWIGTLNGLYKYDGYFLTHYREIPGCTNCGVTKVKEICSVMEDKLGLLWIHSYEGLVLFDPVRERSLLLESYPTDSLINSYFIYRFPPISYSKGIIRIAYFNRLVKYTYVEKAGSNLTRESVMDKNFTETLTRIETKPFANENANMRVIQEILVDNEENTWLGTNDGLFILPKKSTIASRMDKASSQPSRLQNTSVTAILQTDNIFWIGTNNGLYRLNHVKEALKTLIPDRTKIEFIPYYRGSNLNIYSLYRTRNNSLLVGECYDLLRLKTTGINSDYEFESLLRYQNDPTDYGYELDIENIIQDRSGNIWACLAYYGLLKFIPERSIFNTYKKIMLSDFENFDLNPIYEDAESNLWIGTYGGGLYKIPKNYKKITNYKIKNNNNRIYCLEEISQGIFWEGLYTGIYEFNAKTGQFTEPFPNSPAAKDLGQSGILDILRDGGQVYMAGFGGIYVFDLKDRHLQHFTFGSNDSINDTDNVINSLLKLKDGRLLAATSNMGIRVIHYDSLSHDLKLLPFTRFHYSDSIIMGGDNTLYEDVNRRLWIGNGYGLHQLNSETGRITTYKIMENIDQPFVRSILEDNFGNLWLGTQFGLCRFNIKTGRTKVFTREDGLPILIHGNRSAHKNKDGRMFFGGIGGFYNFHPDSLSTNDSVPTIVITSFRLFNRPQTVSSEEKSVLKSNISYTRHIELSHDQNDFSFEFSALDFRQPMKNKYAYKLEPYQEKWILTDAKNRIANYTNLNPGKYVFRVKGSNNDGVWNETGASLEIIIRKPWWRTTLAWSSYILVFVSMVGGYIGWRTKKLKKEKIELENLVKARTFQLEEQNEEILAQRDMLEIQNKQISELDQLKNKFFANVSHEFRTPLSLIQSPVEELLESPARPDKERRKLGMVLRNVQRLVNFVNQLLDISKMDARSLKLELTEGDVMRFLRVIAGSFTSLAEKKSIQYFIHIPEFKINYWFDADKLEKIVINILSNAFKFTPEGGDILLEATYSSENSSSGVNILTITVKDSGKGIPPESLERIFDRFYQVESSARKEGGGTGIGLSLAREMARLMHGDIKVESEICQGSRFMLHIPLGKNHLSDDEYSLLKTDPWMYSVRNLSLEESETVASENEEKVSMEKPLILVVEDNRDIRIQLADHFSNNFILMEAVDGVAGEKKATQFIPDLIITDIMMPRMDGTELCHRLKNDERTSHIPIIMLTAKVSMTDKINGFQIGADDFISKPFHIAELDARVNNLIEQRKKLRERFSREITLEPSEISITPLDEKFLERAIETVERHLSDENFDLPEFRADMNMSRSTLFRKLHALTGQSPTEFIRTIRLKRASSLLKQKFGNVTQVSLEVGFNNLSYFNRSFKKLYGVTPMEFGRK